MIEWNSRGQTLSKVENACSMLQLSTSQVYILAKLKDQCSSKSNLTPFSVGIPYKIPTESNKWSTAKIGNSKTFT